MLKIGSFVTDSSQTSRYDRNVYCVKEHLSDRTVVEFVGTIRNGRIEYSPQRGAVTHRTTSQLVPWD